MTTSTKTDKTPTVRSLDTSIINRTEAAFGTFIDTVIMGQENARQAARRAVRRVQSKLRVGKQPYYVIVAPGPTTCGKSELAYRIAEFFHKDRYAVLKVDGSEYKDKYKLSKLTGASPDHVGYTNRTGKDYIAPLTDQIDSYAQFSQHNLTRARHGSKAPVTVVLIDEWDKACLEFNEVLLSIFRDGIYTLGNGEVVDFSQCLFIITANSGSSAVEEKENHIGIGFMKGGQKTIVTEAEADKIITDHLREFAPPEFRARVEENGEICIFHKLSEAQIAEICELKIREFVAATEKTAGITIEVDADSRKWLLAKTGSVPKLNGGVKTYIIDVLDNELLKNAIKSGDVVHFSHGEAEDRLTITVDCPEILMFSMEEMTAEIAKTPPPASKGDAVVDVEKLKQAVERSDRSCVGDNAGKAVSASSTLVPLQEFVLVYGGVSVDGLEKITASIRAAIEKAPHSVASKVETTLVEPFIGKIEVMANLEDMVALKAHYQGLRVILKGGELA